LDGCARPMCSTSPSACGCCLPRALAVCAAACSWSRPQRCAPCMPAFCFAFCVGNGAVDEASFATRGSDMWSSCRARACRTSAYARREKLPLAGPAVCFSILAAGVRWTPPPFAGRCSADGAALAGSVFGLGRVAGRWSANRAFVACCPTKAGSVFGLVHVRAGSPAAGMLPRLVTTSGVLLDTVGFELSVLVGGWGACRLACESPLLVRIVLLEVCSARDARWYVASCTGVRVYPTLLACSRRGFAPGCYPSRWGRWPSAARPGVGRGGLTKKERKRGQGDREGKREKNPTQPAARDSA